MGRPISHIYCDVVVIGGSTAALFAALHAAREGALTYHIEPTDWIGGQLTAGGVPAVDFAWRPNVQGVNTKEAHKLRANNNYEFYDWLQSIGNPGGCTVSRHCFLPDEFLRGGIAKAIENEPNLFILKNTVPVAVEVREKDNKRAITSLSLLKRFPKREGPFPGYERPLSEAISDWYSRADSEYFAKQKLSIRARANDTLIVVEASELGDVFALSNARYLVGEDAYEGGVTRAFSASGQSFTFAFNLTIGQTASAGGDSHWSGDLSIAEHTFDLGTYDWDGVWNYRRLKGKGDPDIGQVSMMNWKQGNVNNGNDYAGEYLFLSYEDAQQDVDNFNWSGGISTRALRQAEALSKDFCRWYIRRAPKKFHGAISVDRNSVCTEHGFYKFPYLRESRRSVGYGEFLLCAWDLSFYPGPTGYPFEDRAGTTVYDYDIHALEGRKLRSEDAGIYWAEHPKPFFIPIRSLSNDSISNLIVSGKCMAQTFRASAATRLQPGEAVSGTAAGVVAAYCALQKQDMHKVIEQKLYPEIQARVSRYQPLEWTIEGERYPQLVSDKEQLKSRKAFIPNTAWSDSLGAHFDRDFMYFESSVLDLNKIGHFAIEKVEVEGRDYYRFSKPIGFYIVGLTRALTCGLPGLFR